MKRLVTELEEINTGENSSFNLMVNPNLSDFFFWHFHPELELVYIDGADGTRHVGEHLSQYVQNDLVLIGSYIPHLNFDYGIKTNYEKMVVHMRPDFLETAFLSAPELEGIKNLFELSRHGVAFGPASKNAVGTRLKLLHTLDPFLQFTELLNILHILSKSMDQSLLHEVPVRNQHTEKDQAKLRQVYSYIDDHYRRKISIAEVAGVCNLTPEAFCRYFKKMTRLTFTEFVNHYRIDKAKTLLLTDVNITETCFECGFESVSYFNRIFKRVTSENPLAYKRRMREF